MKKFIGISLILASSLFAKEVKIDNGWQLLGTNTSIGVKEFKKGDVKILWFYHKAKGWMGYSPDPKIKEKIINYGYNTISLIPANSGFWLKGAKSTTINIPQSIANSDYNLSTGFQLLGTSRDISLDSFKDKPISFIWQYDSQNKKWMYYTTNSYFDLLLKNNLALEKIDKIKAFSGFWVLSTNPITLSNTPFNLDLTLKSKVEELQHTTKVANLNDAKNFVTQIREAQESFINLNNHDDISTVVGKQSNMIDNYLKPAVDDIKSDLNSTIKGLDRAVDAFDESLDKNFDDILDSIDKRIQAISDTIDAHKNQKQWQATTSYHDSIKYKKVGKVENITINNQTATITYEDSSLDADVKTFVVSGDITLSGSGYDLKVTKISYQNKRVNIEASGIINGKNNSYMNLKSLKISFDVDKSKEDSLHFMQNLEEIIDGVIVSDGRKLVGKLTLNDNSNQDNKLVGTFTGINEEPSFEGTIIIDTALSNLKDIADDDDKESEWISPNALLFVRYESGDKSFVTHYSRKITTGLGEQLYTLYTENGQSLECTTQDNYVEGKHLHSISCSGGEVITHPLAEDKVVELVFSDGHKGYVKSAWENRDYNNGVNVTWFNMNIRMQGDVEWYRDQNRFYINGQPVKVTQVNIREPRDLDDFDYDILLDGKILDDQKEIKAKIGLKGIKNLNKDIVYGEDVFIKDDTNTLTIGNLVIVTDKDRDDTHYTNYHSIFENYTINYNDYYSQNEDDEKDIYKIVLNNLSLSIKDNNNNTLTFDGNLRYVKNSSNNEEWVYKGSYKYTDATFVGEIDLLQNKEKELYASNIDAKITANGFVPFVLKYSGVINKNLNKAYALIQRGNSYKIAILSIRENTEDSRVKIVDTNGVISEFSTDDVTKTLKNKNGDMLATYGKTNGNSWEVTYSDGSSETLF